ncbi:MAG: hypothetical protein WCW78_02695 [Candidatus Paceibacterota bacterium]|jgi:hypothetical protein
MKKDKLFFYDFEGKKIRGTNLEVVLVSQIELPPFSRKLQGMCAYRGYTKFKNIPLGTKLTLAFGDPRIIEDVVLISKKKGDLPKDILEMVRGTSSKVFAFEYQGKKFWVDPSWICRLEDLPKKKKEQSVTHHIDAHHNPR